jgi:hypothetical protein
MITVEPIEFEVAYDNDIYVDIDMQVVTQVVNPEEYEGEYAVTPTQVRQVLSTERKVMTGDITIEPIPSNYGLITWDGSSITVS